jgi:putative ABC transport system permease protein
MFKKQSTNVPEKGMKYKTLIYLAIRNLLFKRLRTILTAGGVVIGIGAIVFLVTFAFGLRDTVNEQVVGSESVKTIDVTSPDTDVLHITDETVTTISELSGVEKVAKTYILPGKVEFNKSTSDAVTYGVDDEYLNLLSPQVITGSLDLSNTSSAIVNLALLETIGVSDPNNAMGQELDLRAVTDEESLDSEENPIKKVKISGVVDLGTGAGIYTSGRFIEENVTRPDYTQLKVVSDTQENVYFIRHQIESQGLTTQSPIDTIDEINRLFSIFAFILGGFGAIGMVIAVLGMFNTLTISLLERTQEIGLMMSIGARRKDVKKLFMAEALALSLIGGIGGIIGAVILGTIINLVLSTMARSRGLEQGISLFSSPMLFILGIILFVLMVGYLVVFFPARRASRINPIDALRHE